MNEDLLIKHLATCFKIIDNEFSVGKLETHFKSLEASYHAYQKHESKCDPFTLKEAEEFIKDKYK
jgi:hypothetical protein